jgi:menaquinone-dependent protoporphyrinogen oxidase
MKVLVAVASKHGATDEIAREIAARLRDVLSVGGPRATVEARAVEQVVGLDGYDAVVLGSAVYMGHWLRTARVFAAEHAAALAAVPVWLFSSGPVGDPPQPEQPPTDAAIIAAAVGAREHRSFVGRLDTHRLGLVERTMVRAVHAAEGDFRDWPAIREWAQTIGGQLRGERAADSGAPAASPPAQLARPSSPAPGLPQPAGAV